MFEITDTLSDREGLLSCPLDRVEMIGVDISVRRRAINVNKHARSMWSIDNKSI